VHHSWDALIQDLINLAADQLYSKLTCVVICGGGHTERFTSKPGLIGLFLPQQNTLLQLSLFFE